MRPSEYMLAEKMAAHCLLEVAVVEAQPWIGTSLEEISATYADDDEFVEVGKPGSTHCIFQQARIDIHIA